VQVTVRIVRWSIVGVWLVLLVGLVRQGTSTHPASAARDISAPAPSSLDEADEWMGIYLQGRKIGYTHHRVERTARGYRFTEQSVMRLGVLDSVQTVRTTSTGTMGEDFGLKAFDVSLSSGVGDLRVRGEVENHAVSLRLRTGAQEQKERFDLKGPLYVPSLARRRLVELGLASGRTLTVDVFDPSSMTSERMRLVVGDQEAGEGGSGPLWRVHESFRGIESTVWLNQAGTAFREEGPMGLVARREDSEQALAGGWEKDAVFDLTAAIAIPVRVRLDDPRHLHRLAVRLRGIDRSSVPADDRQSFRDGLLTIVRENLDASPSYALPYGGAEWREELQATPFLQVDHPSVRAAARRVLGAERDARRAATRLRTWVFESLEKRPTASIPNAVQVLEMKAGDCNEHAVVFAALARAAGIPARVVAGVVYVDGVFLYHAWNELWLGGGWVSADAALDQMPVDATHIRLVSGGPESHTALVPLMGRLGIEIVSANPTAPPAG
jgi:hypothetical protein